MAKTRKQADDRSAGKLGGPPHEAATAWASGRRAGFVQGFCSALNQGIRWAEELAPGTGKEVAAKLVPHLERMIPDAEKLFPTLERLRDGKPYDGSEDKPV